MAAQRTHNRLEPGTRGFTVALAAAMAMSGLAVAAVVPAYAPIRSTFGLSDDSNDVAALVSFYLLGSGLGLLPAGVLADRFGRRTVLFGGNVVYLFGAVISALAPTFSVLLLGRVIWGIGSAGPRVAVLAMIRDSFVGEQMAKQMSLLQAVFLLVPSVAPTIGAALILAAPWQAVVWLCATMSLAVLVVTSRLPETLPAEARRAVSGPALVASVRAVLRAPGTIPYLVGTTALFGTTVSFIASSETIYGEVFGVERWFPLLFGAMAVTMSVAMLVSSRLVERVGLDRMIRNGLAVQIGITTGLLGLVLATAGKPPLVPFVVLGLAIMACQQTLNPNLNSAAMRPLGSVAGAGAAIVGMAPMIGGPAIATLVDRQFNRTVTPMAIAFVAAAVVAHFAARWAVASTRGRPGPAGSPTAEIWTSADASRLGH